MNEKNYAPGQWTPLQLTFVALSLVAAIILGTFAILWQINTFSMQLTMKGDREITLEYGEEYVEPGAEAIFQGSIFMKDPTPVEVIIEGAPDTTTVGTYQVTYTSSRIVESLFGAVEAKDTRLRTIHVVDTQLPEITLVSDPEVFTFPGQTYEEEGFTAFDDYDGDITDKVIRTDDGVNVTYRVSDSSGNTVEAVREIIYNDPIPPELNLEGKAVITLEVGQSYTEPGYSANDNCDGDLTEKVVVTGTVDASKVGSYTISYSVLDTYENEATAQRTVNVIKPETKPTTAPTESNKATTSTKPTESTTEKVNVSGIGGVIYLTFDDGPSYYTPKLLDILAKYNVKATFFVVNTDYIGTISRIHSEGHTVAMHTATHNFKQVYANETAYFNDLGIIQSQIKKYCGFTSTLVRFPGGSSNTVSKNYNKGIMTRLTAELDKKGYTYFDWNVDSDDAGSARTATTVYNNVVTGCASRKTSVVLMHDIKGYSVNAVEDIIRWGLDNGYTFKALTASSPTFHHRLNN